MATELPPSPSVPSRVVVRPAGTNTLFETGARGSKFVDGASNTAAGRCVAIRICVFA